MPPVLNNLLSSYPTNSNVGYNNSWVEVENDSNRPLFAQASYVTNAKDIQVTLSASNVQIGNVALKDEVSGATADVVASDGYNALRVLTQDFESNVDDITIGDRDSNFASVVPHLSSLKVTVTNFSDSPNVDAFGRFRVSVPYALFESKSIYDKPRYFWNSVSRDAAEVFNENDASRTSTVSATNGFFVKETYRRFAYQPGKSQLVLFTGIVNAETNVVKRVGMFTSLSGSNYTENMQGMYFQAIGNSGSPSDQNYAWVINNTNMLVPSQSAVQANWNLDKMDGTGPSKITLDFSKSQIFVIDFEWLGVGRIRFGFNVGGNTYYVHEVLNANRINGTYLRNPNLPIRAEIRSIGGTGSLKTICTSVMSEGGEDPTFVTRSVSVSSAFAPTQNQRVGILGIRLNPNRTNGVNEIIDVSCVCDSGSTSSTAPYKVEIVLRPTPVNVNWTDVSPSSNIQFAQAPTSQGITVSDGNVAVAQYAANTSTIDLDKPQYSKTLKLGKSLQGVPDEMWLVVTSLSNKMESIWASITVAEAD